MVRRRGIEELGMDGKEGGCATAVLCFIAAFWLFGGGRERISHTITADLIVCTNPKTVDAASAQCIRKRPAGKFIVTVTPSSNSCAMKEESPELSHSNLKPGSHLTFVDTGNWRCEFSLSDGLQQIAELSDGEFSLKIVDKDHLIPDDPFAVERSDTIWGTVKHYLRLIGT